MNPCVDVVDGILRGDLDDLEKVGLRLAEALAAREAVGPIPPVLACVVQRASRDAPHGFRSAAEFERALRLWRDSVRPVASPPPSSHPVPGWVSPLGWGLGAIGVVGAIIYAEVPSAPRRVVVSVESHSRTVPEVRRIDGVAFAPERAARALTWVNQASSEEIRSAGLPAQAREAILAGRPFDDLGDVGALSGVGPATMRAVAEAAERYR